MYYKLRKKYVEQKLIQILSFYNYCAKNPKTHDIIIIDFQIYQRVKYSNIKCIVINFVFRGYSTKKLQNNVQCEIFQTLFEEAKDSYDNNIVHELRNETYADMERNISQISAWISQWIKDNVCR